MKTERIFTFLFGLILLLISLLAVLMTVSGTTILDYLENFLRGTNERLLLGIIGVIGILSGLFIIRKTFKVPEPTQTEVIVTSLGQVKITISTLESMANKVARQITGVRETLTKVKSTPGGIAIFMQVSLTPEINIPEVTSQIQNELKEYFAKVAGIEVEEVRILVTKLNEAKNKPEKSRLQ
ncbi:MAG: alkaline shock response membrane anchor protein AmaP [Clostridia bacterium]|nr:alkaline shock response membrane anchor protein AmaP [Clostridia bacterium]